MTNEEAVKLLNDLVLTADFEDSYGDAIDDSPYVEAVEKAVEALKYQETIEQLGNCYIVPKDSTWVVNGVDIQKVLKMQYLKSLAKMENNGSGKND